jgi:hypothetical protein
VAKPPSKQASKWRRKAEEYRMLADCACGDAARETYETLADDYEKLAEHRAHTDQAIGGSWLKNDELDDCEDRHVGVRDEMGSRGIDILTPALTAAFLGALVLLIMPGDQTGEMLEWLGSTMATW